MPRCSVCNTRYIASKVDRCPICGWDVHPLSFVTGLIPEAAQKDAVRLEWAKQLWSKAKLGQDQLRQLQIQGQESSDREQQLQAQLDKANQEAANLKELLRQHEATIAQLQAKLQQAQPPSALQAPDLDQSNLEVLPPPVPIVPEVKLQELTAVEPIEIMPNLLEDLPSVEAPRRIESFAGMMSLPDAVNQLSLQPLTVEAVIIQTDGRQIQECTVFARNEPLGKEINLEMIYIPAGQFWMGSLSTESGRDCHESPRHGVTIAPFLMSRYPVTQAQWKAIAALPKIHRSLNLYPSDFEGDDRPVEQVSWYDTIEFCARLSKKTGRYYRLPSEAEWEYACRAGTVTAFHFGDTIASDLANYDGNYTYSYGIEGIYRQGTTPVWTFAIANSFGLSDMHGNVWEWCADAWHDNYEGMPVDGSVWQSDDEVAYRVLRGGAWYCLPELCRSAQRHWNQPDMGGSGIGFRVVCAVG